MRFSNRAFTYEISIDETNQNTFTVNFDGQTENWDIETKDFDGISYRLCGITRLVPRLGSDGDWYELILSKVAEIKYWGTGVLHRHDIETD
ncbi:MAG: hypothetical protein AAGI14_10800 [Pseudomonadota bacterium]